MSASQIIEAIKQLPLEEQAEVLRFAREFDLQRRLSPEELEALGRRLADATDPNETKRLTEELVRGFYGGEAHA
jgi:hypothetical protein